MRAAFSLKQSAGEGLTAAKLVAVQRCRKVISRVATQEMLHLALVQNLLSAVGAAPHLSRPNFPHPARHYPAGVRLALLPFGEQALRHFMFFERPEGMSLDDAQGLSAFRRAAAMAHLAGKYGERWLFAGPPRAQATGKHFRWPELVAVTDLVSAQHAIDTILKQGKVRGGTGRTLFRRSASLPDRDLAAG